MFEAMSCGFPVVAAYVLGVREVLATGKCGLLVPPNQPGEKARAIERVPGYAEFARRMGVYARLYVETNHSVARMAARCREVLDVL